MPTARLPLLPVLVLLLASCAGSPAARDSAPADVVTAAAAGTPASDEGAESDAMVCRREVVTGTNFQREVCRTRAQREAIERETRELVRERRSQSLGK